MAVDGWSRVLVLGGIRSGKSDFAESLIRDVPAVRYVATAVASPDDPEWAARIEAHRQRRPAGWLTEEVNGDPARLVELLGKAGPDETLLVDDLGGWVTGLLDPAHQPADQTTAIDELGAAVRTCAARLVLVSPEVGLSVVPTTPLGRAFVDALGGANQAVADACDAVVLVVAGQPTWLKPRSVGPAREPAGPGGTASAVVPAQPVPGHDAADQPSRWAALVGAADAPSPEVLRPTPSTAAPTAASAAPAATETAPASTEPTWAGAPTVALPVAATGPVIQPGMELPMPDEDAGPAALNRLATLDLPGAGFGRLAEVVGFAAATQGTATPRPWQSVRVLLLHGDHSGGAAAGTVPGDSARRAAAARAGVGPLARLAAEVGATLQVVTAPTAAPIEDGPALSADDVEAALRYGWRLAEEAVEDGAQLLVIGACGAGTEAAAAAVLAVTTAAEAVAVLGRVVTPGGQVDDAAWMRRCAAVRDALHRTRRSPRDAKDVLAELGGGDIAIATGVLLGATARRTPVLLDGPVGVAAALVSRDLAGQARHWCLLPDHGDHPAVRLGAEVLGLTPLVNLRLSLGEGATALAALPLLRSALTLAGTLPIHPMLGGDAPEAEPVGTPDTAPLGTPAADGTPPERVEPAAPEPNVGGDADEHGDGSGDQREFVEPEPAGPGPTSIDQPTEPTPPSADQPTESGAGTADQPGEPGAEPRPGTPEPGRPTGATPPAGA